MAQEKWLVEGPKTIDIETARKLKIGLFGGQLDVVGHDEEGIRVEVHAVSGKPLKVTLDGDVLEIDHPQLGWDNWIDVFRSIGHRASADVSVMVPRAMALKVGVVSATALISGLVGDADASTVSGDLVLDGLRGELQLNTVSGELTVRDHTGRITAHSVSGDLTASGAITSVSADSVSGAVFLDIAGIPDEIKANTVSGAVTARLDAGTPASYTVSTVGGRVQLGDAEITGIHGRYTGKHGVLDQHWADIRVNTVSGGVSVLHTTRASGAEATA